MDTLSFKTYTPKPENINKKWVLVDAEGQTLGRLASHIAMVLRGKNKPGFAPHMDTGDNVVVINAEKVVLTGKKIVQKEYFRYSGYPGGERFSTPEEMLERKPTFIIENAVRGMLPKNRLGRQLMRNIRVYAGPVHPHNAQKPEKITF
ncbi:MAG TPA: 50S ribosomal protein L13 [Balneolales bacterium]|nr:50S ribosomal protein L13 [Balneolales bacterium]